MTSDDGTTPGAHWDEARVALERVAQFFNRNDEFALDELRGLENYELIPAPVRQTLEELTPDERQLLKRVFTTLGEHQFYLENSRGGLEEPY